MSSVIYFMTILLYSFFYKEFLIALPDFIDNANIIQFFSTFINFTNYYKCLFFFIKIRELNMNVGHRSNSSKTHPDRLTRIIWRMAVN